LFAFGDLRSDWLASWKRVGSRIVRAEEYLGVARRRREGGAEAAGVAGVPMARLGCAGAGGNGIAGVGE
jgi:hypothetical protein